MGIQGKVLDEEVPKTSANNIELFTRFKKRHPEQMVLLHYNGRARDPRHEGDRFFAGHWLYRSWTGVLPDVPAEEGETGIRVEHPENFRVGVGYYGHTDKTDELVICAVGPDGKPNFHESEQVRVVSVDSARKTVRVERGYLFSEPRAFKGGRAMVARHIFQGPCGRYSNLMWNYNFSTRSPRDAQGRSCADVLLASLLEKLRPGGPLETFDGVQFDVLMHEMDREADCDGDGRADNGVIDGVNTFGIGTIEFCRRLRAGLGESKLILADGFIFRNQRAFGILNGIESEGWPSHTDPEVHDWSGGMNRHAFWAQNGRTPILNYMRHGFVGPDGHIDVPFSRHRLVFAAALFTDSALTSSYNPPREKGEVFGIYDEFVKGAENELGWLGRPPGPARRLAVQTPDLLKGAGSPPGVLLRRRFSGEDGVSFAIEDGAVRVQTKNSKADALRFSLTAVPCNGPDLFVSVTMRGAAMARYPKEMARMAKVYVPTSDRQLVRTDDLPRTGMCIRGQQEAPADPQIFASVKWRSRAVLAGVRRAAYLVHPPGTKYAGYTFWERDVNVPEDGRLVFYTGMGERAPGRSDGVTFRVSVAEWHDGELGECEQVFEHSQVASEWVRHDVPLARWAGKRVCLRFISDSGPNDSSRTDHSHWGDVWIMTKNDTRIPNSKRSRYMTWVNDRAFTSGFSFDVRATATDIGFEIEGRDPVWIEKITIHAHPDAIGREYEQGAVLANPGLHDYTFDMARLFPGREFRRLHGTPPEDPETNDGSAIGAKLTLGERDALFLVGIEDGE